MIFIILLSFFLDGILSIYLDKTIFLPLLSIMSLVVTYSYINNDKKFYVYSLLLGFLYDVIYTGTPLINTVVFFVIALLIKLFYKYINSNIISTLIISCLLIIFYRLMIYAFLITIGYFTYDGLYLWKTIYSSFITNIIYVVITYIIIKKIKNKRSKKKYSTFVRKKY